VNININIITPVGNLEDLDETIESINEVSKKLIDYNIRLFLILNNNINYSLDEKITLSKNLKVDINNINPIASRSKARNYALNKIDATAENSFTIFLDSGDKLLHGAINDLKKFKKELTQNNFFLISQSYIQLRNMNIMKKIPLFPIFLRKIVNPFLLGGIILKSSLAKKVRFYEGKKEDWVYWNKILDLKPSIYKSNNFNYIYKVNDTSKHYKNKFKSNIELQNVLIKQLKWSRLASIPIFFLHTIIIILRWLYLNISSNI
jgi:hypothetical protein|tara:strand:- start:4428 stop:5213 length:786 start_codon:yes stop_codon:yes gene_type:complete